MRLSVGAACSVGTSIRWLLFKAVTSLSEWHHPTETSRWEKCFFDSAKLLVSLRISVPSQIILSKMLSWTILRRHALHKVVTFMVSNKLQAVSLTEEIRSVLNNLYTKSQCDFNVAKHLGLMKYCTVKERSKSNTF